MRAERTGVPSSGRHHQTSAIARQYAARTQGSRHAGVSASRRQRNCLTLHRIEVRHQPRRRRLGALGLSDALSSAVGYQGQGADRRDRRRLRQSERCDRPRDLPLQLRSACGRILQIQSERSAEQLPDGNSSWGVEIDLDVEMVSAVCPNCTIYLDRSERIRHVRPGNGGSRSGDARRARHQQQLDLLRQRIVRQSPSDSTRRAWFYLAASGDYGYNEVGPPSSFPTVVSVGGTSSPRTARPTAKPSGAERARAARRDHQAHVAARHGLHLAHRHDVRAVAGWSPGCTTPTATAAGSGRRHQRRVADRRRRLRPRRATRARRTRARSSGRSAQAATKSGLNDITTGSNGSCGGSYLCTAGGATTARPVGERPRASGPSKRYRFCNASRLRAGLFQFPSTPSEMGTDAGKASQPTRFPRNRAS